MNYSLKHNFSIRLVILCALFLSCGVCSACAGSPFGYYSENITTHTVAGKTLYVYVPPSYSTSTKKYPVVYLHDGQSVFGAGGMNVDGTLQNLVSKGLVEEMIAVGIASGFDRTSDYVPYNDATIGWYSPRGAQYADEIIRDVVPFIDRTYRTLANAENRAIVGYSFGGLHAFWMGVHISGTFGMVAAMSPSFWVADYKMLSDVPTDIAPPSSMLPNASPKVWFDMGTLEWNYYTPLLDTLHKRGYKDAETVMYYEVNGGRHTIDDWAARVQYPLIFFKGKPATTVTELKVEIEVIKSQTRAGVFFLRLNPVATWDNGSVSSPNSFAEFVLLNPSSGDLTRDGRFQLKGEENMNVIIRYRGKEQRLTIVKKEIDAAKARLGG